MTIQGKGQSVNNHLFWVADNIIAPDFPDVSRALRDPDGLLAIGGDLSVERLLRAYSLGIFPWYSEGQPILWWSPDPRCVIEPGKVHISRSLAKRIRRNEYRVSYNQAFQQVIQACARPRDSHSGTWITREMMSAYLALHHEGYAVSVETWFEDKIVGGLYGVVIDRVFFGESMFSWRSDASKVALVHLSETLQETGFRLIDCQIHSGHLQTLGATPMQRELFVNILNNYCISLQPALRDFPDER